ncbi:TonB-dependent receptor plug domain-containing protein [Dongia sp.]|uniref:TonB-dependent receptor plug domain-containing protein n=1 Tax=Dongia sp. TaxID=1977262 RepID=UPI0035B4A949
MSRAATGFARLFAGVLGAACILSPALAQESTGAGSPAHPTLEALDQWAETLPPALPPVIVTDQAPKDAEAAGPEPKNSIAREDFVHDAAPLRVNDVAKRLPGVLTGGGPGEDKEARVFGLDKEFTRTTVNGIPIPDGGEKREFNLDRLPVGMVESVEVIRNRTAEYEADGLAGVVNINTRDIPLEFSAELDLGYGFLDANDDAAHLASGTMGGRIGEHFGLQGSVAYNRVPIYKDKVKLRANGTEAEREYEDKPTDSIDALMDAAFYYDGGEIHIEPMYLSLDEDKNKLKDKFNGAGIFNGSETESEDKIKETIGGTIRQEHAFDLDLPGGANAELRARAGYFHTREDKKKVKEVFNAAGVQNLAQREIETEDKSDAIGFLQSDLKLPLSHGLEHTPQIGFLLRQRDRDKLKDKTVGGVAAVDAKGQYTLLERYYAGYVQDEIRPIEWFVLTPGVRVEYVTLEAEDGDNNVDNSNFFDLLPSLPVAVHITDEITYRASVARLVNRPKFDELSPFADDSAAGKLVIGNPQLKPAKAWAFETSLGYEDDEIGFELGLFHREIKDVIESVATGEIIDGDTVEQVQNVGDGHVQGITLVEKLDLGIFATGFLDDFEINANQTLTRSRLKSADGVSRPFKDQPQFFGNLEIAWINQELGTSISVGGNYVGLIKQVEYGNDDREEEFYLEARLAQRVLPGVELFAVGQNLTNENRVKHKANGETEIENGGRLFLFGLNAKF